MTPVPRYSAEGSGSLDRSRRTARVTQRAARPRLSRSLLELRTVLGRGGLLLVSQLVTSEGEQSSRTAAGAQFSTVLWKQEVSSGSSVSHTEVTFQNWPPQKCLKLDILYNTVFTRKLGGVSFVFVYQPFCSQLVF